MDKLNMGTKNIANENIEKIGQLFPECITEINDGKGKTIKAVDFAVLNDIFNYKVINYSTGGGSTSRSVTSLSGRTNRRRVLL